MPQSSCTTHNQSQGGRLRKVLTTDPARIDILATMGRPKKTSGRALVEIYSKRQPNRPHYLARLMARQNVTRTALIDDLGMDKSLLSRWLDDEKPSTPSPEWAAKLNKYFSPSGDEDDLIDIFADPDVRWIAKKLEGKSDEDKARIIDIIEREFPSKRSVRA